MITLTCESLYHTRDYSDLTILTSDKIRHPVHRAIVCPRSHLLAELVRHQPPESFQHGDLLLEDDDPETVRLMLEYLYLLDYVPLALSRGDSSASHGHSSDGSSTRTEPLAFGNVYGTSAISAFGGPQHHGSVDLQSPFSAVFPNSARDRAESTLTIHAIPRHDLSAYAGGAAPDRRKRTPTRVRPPEPSPLATREPNLTLHARMYAIAVKYGIAGLVALALDKFKIQLTRHWYVRLVRSQDPNLSDMAKSEEPIVRILIVAQGLL